ncbi:MAG: translesion error-prone DNA polymerase V autoproteolytic subunit [Candidatus Paracaedibacteraceae bacterium]|nr:translesion error-prone DNA polymerase V autoproteolytic subunit [Candidatus Paracaedibacteraceae bacterium]
MTARGGKRIGAGRKPNSGKFKEPTQAIRVPKSYIQPLTEWLAEIKNTTNKDSVITPPTEHLSNQTQSPFLKKETKPLHVLHTEPSSISYDIPFYDCTVSAGFPSPADDSFSITMDLNKHLVQNAPATFFVRTSGESMLGAGIHDGDLLVVDRSLTAKSQDIVIAAVNGDLTVKRLIFNNGRTILKAENPEFSNIELTDEMSVSLWGVVTNVIHSLRG